MHGIGAAAINNQKNSYHFRRLFGHFAFWVCIFLFFVPPPPCTLDLIYLNSPNYL
jgi:hypothetical protein